MLPDRMLSRLVLLTVWSLIDCGLSELRVDWQRIEKSRSSPFTTLLLALTPPSPRVVRRRAHPRSFARSRPRAVVTEEATVTADKEFTGVVKSFNRLKKYGFVSSPEIKEEYGGDAFIMQTELNGVEIGDEVAFNLKVSDGRPQATNVRIEKSAKEAAPVAAEKNFTGIMKIYFPQKKYGFISSPQITEEYGRDAFVILPELNAVKIGDKVSFNLKIDDGRPQATNVRVANKSAMDRDLFGVIKAYFPTKKYGFVECALIKKQFKRDAFIMKSDMKYLNIGDEIQFDLKVEEEMPKVTNVRLLGRGAIYEKSQELVKSVVGETVKSASILEEVKELTDSFANLKVPSYGEVLCERWESTDSDIFRASADASDLSEQQRSVLAGPDGSFFNLTTQQFDIDFIWIDAAGKISAYGPNESRVRKAMEKVLWQVAYLLDREKKLEEQKKEEAKQAEIIAREKEEEAKQAEIIAREKAEKQKKLEKLKEALPKEGQEAAEVAEAEVKTEEETIAEVKAEVKEEVADVKAEEARLKAEREAKAKAEEEARVKAEAQAKAKAEEEAKAKAEEEAKAKAAEEAQLKAEEEAKAKAEEEAKAKAEEEAKANAAEEARLKAEEEAKAKEAEATAEEETEDAVECPFQEGQRVKVKQSFLTDSEEPVKLAQSEVGTVLRIDEDGDLLIDFDTHEESQWVYSDSFDNLE